MLSVLFRWSCTHDCPNVLKRSSNFRISGNESRTCQLFAFGPSSKNSSIQRSGWNVWTVGSHTSVPECRGSVKIRGFEDILWGARGRFSFWHTEENASQVRWNVICACLCSFIIITSLVIWQLACVLLKTAPGVSPSVRQWLKSFHIHTSNRGWK